MGLRFRGIILRALCISTSWRSGCGSKSKCNGFWMDEQPPNGATTGRPLACFLAENICTNFKASFRSHNVGLLACAQEASRSAPGLND